jgi:ribosome recycling factor
MPKLPRSPSVTFAATASMLKKSEKDHQISEDDEKRLSNDVQKATDAAIADVDKALATKEKEILTV